jgi:hypothetical protein
MRVAICSRVSQTEQPSWVSSEYATNDSIHRMGGSFGDRAIDSVERKASSRIDTPSLLDITVSRILHGRECGNHAKLCEAMTIYKVTKA